MDDLPIQQQKIMDAVARHWEPITVKELAERTRLVSKTLSAQLNAMEKDQIIVKHDTHNKNKTYQIRERFWNIWYLMRYGRHQDKAKVIWLVRFLESWFSGLEMEKRIESFVVQVKDDLIDEERLTFFSKVYAAYSGLTLESKLMLRDIEGKSGVEIWVADTELDQSAREAFANGQIDLCLRRFLSKSDLANPKPELFMELLASNRVGDFIKNNIDDFRDDLAVMNLAIFLLAQNLVALATMLDYVDNLNHFLNRISEVMIYLTSYFSQDCGSEKENGFLLQIVFVLFKRLVRIDLRKELLAIVERTSIVNSGRSIYLKDIAKPIHLALKYLYQPTELDKQPVEFREPAEQIVKILLGL
jgi:hypothetical protein